jgi:hypothetical protein
VESFNGLWQARTVRRSRYANLSEVAAASDRFCDYYLWRRSHPAVSIAAHGTRFPGQLLETCRDELRFPPAGFHVEDYRDRRGRIGIPLARGRLTYLRRVAEGGFIELAGGFWPVPESTAGLCIAATILTGRKRLMVRLDGSIIAEHPFPIAERVTDPYFPRARRGLYYDIEG